LPLLQRSMKKSLLPHIRPAVDHIPALHAIRYLKTTPIGHKPPRRADDKDGNR
jgi:hypothetical protein